MSDDNGRLNLSRRRILGATGTIGAAAALGGAATTSLLWDEEVFGNASDPNVLQAGRLDLQVDLEANYYDWIDSTPTNLYDTDLIDQPTDNEILINLQDIKPGDVVEKTISLHLFGNPGFIYSNSEIFTDSDNDGVQNEDMPEPEDKVNGHTPDQSDGTDGDGDLDDHMQVLIWLDGYERTETDDTGQEVTTESDGAGNNFPNEILTVASSRKYADSDGDPLDLETFLVDLTNASDPLSFFDTSDAQFVFHGTLRDAVTGAGASNDTAVVDPTPRVWPGLSGDGLLLDASAYEGGTDVEAPEFDSETPYCFRPSSTVYLGVLMWLPRNIPGVDDNIIQTDRIEYGYAFNSIQCRHNVANDGRPLDRTIDSADAENNANGFGGA